VSNLLQISRVHPKAMARKGALPLMMEFTVNALTAPYLVSSSGAVMWVEEPMHVEGKDIVRSAVRQATPALMFADAIRAIVDRGRESEWGNVHPFSTEGVKAAIAHVSSYEMGNLEVLMPLFPSKGKGAEKRPAWTTAEKIGLPVRPTSWLPLKCAVVVPVDREYVGLLTHLSAKHITMAIHNAARSVGIAIGT
jgi:hypothetical protein